jgi:hypothetical protein
MRKLDFQTAIHNAIKIEQQAMELAEVIATIGVQLRWFDGQLTRRAPVPEEDREVILQVSAFLANTGSGMPLDARLRVATLYVQDLTLLQHQWRRAMAANRALVAVRSA